MQVPQFWADALTSIRAVHPMLESAVIAGGALRDLDNGREIRDIDIFVRGEGEKDLFACRERLLEAGFEVGYYDPDKLYPVGENNEVVGYFDVHVEAVEQPFQLIVVKWDTAKIVDRFDFGICKIAFDGRDLVVHPDYTEDKAAQQFRICRERDRSQLEASVHRYARLAQKYPGWPFRLLLKKFGFSAADNLFD